MNWKDIFVRAGKTAVASFFTSVPFTTLTGLDVSTLQSAALAAAAAGGTIIINAVLNWSNS